MDSRPGIVVALALGLALLVPGAAAIDGPAITPGDAWTYATNMTVAEDFYLCGQVTVRALAREPRTVEGVALDVLRMALDGQGDAGGTFDTGVGRVRVTGSWRLTGEEWLEADGLKVVRSLVDVRANGTVHSDPFPQGFLFTLTNTTTFRILEDTWRYPLDVGDEGILVALMNATEDSRFQWSGVSDPDHSEGVGNVSLAFVAEARETVSVPAGSFDALRIRQTREDGSYEIVHYAPRAGNAVRTEARNGTGATLGSADLVSYRYQALEPAGFLGLDGLTWALLLLLFATVTSATVTFALRKRFAKPPPEPRAEGPPPEGP